jgi:hypothetical protein
VEKYSTEIVVRDLIMLDSRGEAQAPAIKQQTAPAVRDEGDDLPF